MTYNPLLNNYFLVFESVETPSVSIPLIKLDNSLSDILYDTTLTTTNQTPERLPRMTDSQTLPTLYDTKISDNQDVTTSLTTNKPKISKGNLDYMSFEDLIKKYSLPIRITSGFRGKGSLRGGKTALGRRSNHNRLDDHSNPMAYDIAPTAGHTFDDIRKAIYSNPDVVNWFRNRGWGVLEEMQDGKRGFYDVSGKFHYTGATGPHFHIGPDSFGVLWYDSKVQLAKLGMKFGIPMMLQGNTFLLAPFGEFVPVEEPKVELNLPLLNNPIDISDWAQSVSENGNIRVRDNRGNLPRMIDSGSSQQLVNSQPSQTQQLPSTSIKLTEGSLALSTLIDEVSNEPGYEGLKDSLTKNMLLRLAKRESNFKSNTLAKGSTAIGYFLFIDSTRQKYSSVSRSLFLNDPKELIRAAYKMYKNILDTSDAKLLLSQGYNVAQVTALGWWYPKAMKMVLNGKTNFSLGGYSIRQALNDNA